MAQNMLSGKHGALVNNAVQSEASMWLTKLLDRYFPRKAPVVSRWTIHRRKEAVMH